MTKALFTPVEHPQDAYRKLYDRVVATATALREIGSATTDEIHRRVLELVDWRPCQRSVRRDLYLLEKLGICKREVVGRVNQWSVISED